MMRLGFIGTGHLTGFLVDGLVRARAPYTIAVSPRGAAKAAELKARHNISVAPDNQSVVDDAEIIIVAVLPQDGIRVMSELRFRKRQIVISAMAALGMSAVSRACHPATPVLAMMPGLANAHNVGPTIIYPRNQAAEALFACLGPVIAFEEEAKYITASSFGGMSGISILWMAHLMKWFERNGLSADEARSIVAGTIRGNAHVLLETRTDVDQLGVSIATPGGITEMGQRIIKSHGVPEAWDEALTTILKRMRG